MQSQSIGRYVSARQELGNERANKLADLFGQFKLLPSFGNHVGFASLYVTGRCHLSCPHCYAEEEFAGLTKDASTEQMIAIINFLCTVTKRVQLTGGEIFMRVDPESKRNDTLLLVDEIFKRDRETIMQTTGMHLTDKMLDFCATRNVEWFSLSLDGPDIESNNLIRGKDEAFTKTLELIPKLKRRGFKVKVGTTITAITADRDQLFRLGEMITGLGVDNWKITQFFGREAGRASGENAHWLNISDATYKKVAEEMVCQFGSKICVTTHSLSDFSASPALLVQPTGVITVTQGTKDIFVGNILQDTPERILENLRSLGGLSTISMNAQKTYRKELL